MSDAGGAEGGEADGALQRAALASQLRELEAFVARSEAEGEEMPPEAREMVTRLREIVSALDGLTASFGEAPRRADPE